MKLMKEFRTKSELYNEYIRLKNKYEPLNQYTHKELVDLCNKHMFGGYDPENYSTMQYYNSLKNEGKTE